MPLGLATTDQLAKLRADMLRMSAPASLAAEVQRNTRFILTLKSDETIENILHGPLVLKALAITGTLTLRGAAKIVDSDGSYWDKNGIVLVSPGAAGDSINFRYAAWAANRPQAILQSAGDTLSATLSHKSRYGDGTTTTSDADVETNAKVSIATVSLRANAGTSPYTEFLVVGRTVDTDAYIQAYVHGRSILTLQYTDWRVAFNGRVYPGNAGATQLVRYLADNGTYMDLQGPVNIGASTLGGVATNWSGFGVANIPNTTAGYLQIYINGTARRIPYYNDA